MNSRSPVYFAAPCLVHFHPIEFKKLEKALDPAPGGHGLTVESMLDPVIYVSSARLTTCSPLLQLGSCEMHFFLSMHAKIKSISATPAYH